MESDVPYMPSVKNLPAILDAIQNAGAPDAFGLDFLKDLGFTSSNDRAAIKVLKYLGMLDSSGRPQAAYREFMDHNKAKQVLAGRLRQAYDDLFVADKDAHNRETEKLKGWFKTKTGVSDSVARKIATTFKSLASYADFTSAGAPAPGRHEAPAADPAKPKFEKPATNDPPQDLALGLSYRIEVNLPDTTNVDTYRAIFRAIREELLT